MPAYLRVRTRPYILTGPGTVVVHRPDGSVYSTQTAPSMSRALVLDEFHDVTGAREKVKPCSHETVRSSFTSRPTVRAPSNWYDTSSNWFESLDVSALKQVIPNKIPSTVVAEMADKAFNALVPQIPQEVSIPNFLYELREIASLVPRLSSNLAQTVGGGYLTYAFGWKPFVADIQALLSLMSTIRTRLEYLRDTWGRETRVSFSSPFDLAVDVPESVTLYGSYTYRRTSWRGIFTCGGYLYHELQDLDGLIGEYRALAAATGFTNPLQAIWEAIPFSFVLDWFGRVGSLVSRTPIQPFVGPWEIRRLTHSWKWTGTYELVISFPSGYVPSKYTAIQGTYSGYSRDVGLPVSSSIFSSDSLSPQQQVLALALLAASTK